MRTLVAAVCLALAVGCAHAANSFATMDTVRLINRAQKNWHASITSPVARMDPEDFKGLLGVDVFAAREDPQNAPERTYSAAVNAAAPEEFDSRAVWPQCKSLTRIRDQSACGSCWAFATVDPMSDRECIVHGKNVFLSQEDMNSCSGAGGCNGGYPSSAFSYLKSTGVVTEECRPYSFPSCDHHIPGSKNPCPPTQPTPKCVKSCVNGAKWEDDKHKVSKTYTVRGEANMMTEVSTYGPCEVAFEVYEDFMLYTSGIYSHVTGRYQGGHAVRLLGYGIDNGVKYWLIANSWNPNWGEKGYFRIIRGKNECGIENVMWCGTPL